MPIHLYVRLSAGFNMHTNTSSDKNSSDVVWTLIKFQMLSYKYIKQSLQPNRLT